MLGLRKTEKLQFAVGTLAGTDVKMELCLGGGWAHCPINLPLLCVDKITYNTVFTSI